MVTDKKSVSLQNTENINDVTKSLTAEQSVLGSVLIEPALFSSVTEIISEDDFAYEQNAVIFGAMNSLYNNGKPIDLVVLVNRLRDKGQIEEAGGIEYISELSSAPDFSKNIREYARIVKDKSVLRRIISVSNSLTRTVYEGASCEDVLEKAEKGIFDVSQEKSFSTLEHIKSPLLDAFTELEKNYKNKKPVTGLQTGFADLDYKTKGLQKSDMIVIAARPGTGKTALGLNLALNTALRDKSSVAIFSLEMSSVQLVQRLISSSSMVELSKIKDGNLDTDDFSKIYNSINMLSSLKIYIDDTPGISMAQIKSKCRRQKIKDGLDMVVIDFLQLIEPQDSREPRQVQVSGISRAVKIMAKELDCPVIAMSQINRDSEKSKDHRPMLSDLRESGAIEQDADLVMFLYRDEMYNPDTDKPGITELIIAKHRNGETGTVDLSWLGNYQKFIGVEKNY